MWRWEYRIRDVAPLPKVRGGAAAKFRPMANAFVQNSSCAPWPYAHTRARPIGWTGRSSISARVRTVQCGGRPRVQPGLFLRHCIKSHWGHGYAADGARCGTLQTWPGLRRGRGLFVFSIHKLERNQDADQLPSRDRYYSDNNGKKRRSPQGLPPL